MSSLRIFLTLFLFALVCHEADAQIQVELKLDRKLYVAHEPITGELIMVNRAGRDLVFGDSGGLSWLDFSVTDSRGALITPIANHVNERSIVLAAGQTYRHKVTINRYYPMANIGLYRVKANVTFPSINRVFTSQQQSVQITDGQPMWNQIVTVPPGYPDAGRNREYSLMTFYHGARGKSIYFRMKDSDTGMVYKTYPIGDYMTVRKPTQAIDAQNSLHILHMSGPQAYKYTVIGVHGDPIKQENLYEKGSNRPQLRSTDYGEVSVVGGITQQEKQTPYEQVEFRRLSERPPGLPTQ
ncbi:MAG: hypothetical protein MI807_07025 [Verrucomicrobiales bacterium]|nr:hypothetical protein [Verrucomicrobiales bacterium]